MNITSMKKAILFCASVAALVAFPLGAQAAEESVTVHFSAFDSGKAVVVDRTVVVSSEEVENYYPSIEDSQTGVTYLDALVAVHRALYPSTFTKYLALSSGSYGVFVSKQFGGDYPGYYLRNNEALQVSTSAQILKDGDVLVALGYSSYKNPETPAQFKTLQMRTTAMTPITFSLTGSFFENVAPWDTITKPVSGAKLALINPLTNVITPLSTTTDKEGVAVRSFKNPGTYYVTAQGTLNNHPIIGAFTRVDVSLKPTSIRTSSAHQRVKVVWSRRQGVSGYAVYRATSARGHYKRVATVKGASSSRYVSGRMKPGKRYYYKVRTYKNSGGKTYYSPYTAVRSIRVHR